MHVMGRDKAGSVFARMTTDWLAKLHDLAGAAYEIFLWPGNYFLSQVPVYAPGLALQLGIAVEETSIVTVACIAAVAWIVSGFLAWKTVKTVFAHSYYAASRLKNHLVDEYESSNRHRVLIEPVLIPDVELDDLDLAVLDLGSTLPPGLALTASELSGQLIKRPAQVQQSLDKLRSYGLVDDTIGSTDGYDNYCLTRSGAAMLSRLHNQGKVVSRNLRTVDPNGSHISWPEH